MNDLDCSLKESAVYVVADGLFVLLTAYDASGNVLAEVFVADGMERRNVGKTPKLLKI